MTETHIASISKSSKKKNRRKKRRTQDVSDSSSDSSSDSEQSLLEDDKSSVRRDVQALGDSQNSYPEGTEKSLQERDKNDDMEVVLSDNELEDDANMDGTLSNETLSRLNEVKFTNTEIGGHSGSIDLKKVSDMLDDSSSKLLESTKKDKNGLKNQYLSMMFENYGDDLNELRKAPDFSSKTLVMLANVLKDAGDIFDLETLKTIVEGNKN